MLVPLNCKIDIKNMVLRTDNANIAIRDDIKSYTRIEPKCERVINILCNYEGEYFTNGKKTQSGLIFLPAIISVKEGNALTIVINTSGK